MAKQLKTDTIVKPLNFAFAEKIVEALGLDNVLKLTIEFDWNARPRRIATATAVFLVKNELDEFAVEDIT